MVNALNRSLVGIVGLGYVGLSLARALSQGGVALAGYDTDERRVHALKNGVPPISELQEDDLTSILAGGFRVSTTPEILSECGVLIFALPTPLGDGNVPDLSFLMNGLQTAARNRKSKQLWIIESTIAPGMVRDQILPALVEEGLVHGRDFLLAFSPERVNPGMKQPLVEIPKVVAGHSLEARKEAATFYTGAGFSTVLAGSIDEAASAKMLENTYRAVNIALINELSPLFHRKGIRPHEVVRLAATKPFGFQEFWPGPGVGGHCIPVDPWYMISALVPDASVPTLIGMAMAINSGVPGKVALRISEIARNLVPSQENPRVLLCGLTYKAGVGDFRDSPGLEVARSLVSLGNTVGYHDPFLSEPLSELSQMRFEFDAEVAAPAYDVVAILQNHEGYRNLADVVGIERLISAAASPNHFAPQIWDPKLGVIPNSGGIAAPSASARGPQEP